MSASVKYTVARLALFVGIAAAMMPLPLDLFVKLMIAILVSAAASYFVLRRLREQVAEEWAVAADRRREQKAKLRAALAGEDAPADASK
ncbi:DUF4229 domain-containing protein [Pilimelia columellifera]|uniref:DUF4229 domain-containing protein n=1 Tax=Pilimelia columellifera subsp. columellifera TaxID=706583 RepID=A0ABP6A4P6_9ACTN